MRGECPLQIRSLLIFITMCIIDLWSTKLNYFSGGICGQSMKYNLSPSSLNNTNAHIKLQQMMYEFRILNK